MEAILKEQLKNQVSTLLNKCIQPINESLVLMQKAIDPRPPPTPTPKILTPITEGLQHGEGLESLALPPRVNEGNEGRA